MSLNFILKKIINYGALLAMLCFVGSSYSLAKNNEDITVKLWGGLKTNDVENLKSITHALSKDDYNAAMNRLNLMQNENSSYYDAVRDIVLWNKYSQSKIDTKKIAFSDISRFVNDNQFFPNISDLKKNVEKIAVANDIPYDSSVKYFKAYPAANTDSKLYLLKSKINYLDSLKTEEEKQNLQSDIQKSISDIWVNENFSAEEENKFLQNYGGQLGETDHVKRIDRLLWDSKFIDAQRIFYLVNEEYRQLFTAIILISRSPKYIDNIILTVPRKLRANEGLYYRRILYYKATDQIDEVIDLLEKIPAANSHPDKWWNLKKYYSREMLKKKEYKSAYNLADSNGLTPGTPDYAEAEWVAGWIALRFEKDPKKALNHFNNLYLNVSYPVSISRAAYWLGMTHQALSNREQAIYWYKIAAKYPTYFYGQLAIHKHRTLDSVGSQNDIILPKDPEVTGSDITAISKMSAAKVAYILAVIGEKTDALKVFEYAINNAGSEGQIVVIMKIANEINDRELTSKVSRMAARRNVIFIADKFQILKEVENDPYSPLIHALIKQESDFSPVALSSVGAIGFMQLMPDTAKRISKQIGLPYSKRKLATNAKYNIIVGSFYIKSLIEKFNGSELLAIASYNAGPGAAQRWIDEFYDPRKEKDIDRVIDWIELITYAETRNYVQRIMENLIVYKYIMSRVNYDDIK